MDDFGGASAAGRYEKSVCEDKEDLDDTECDVDALVGSLRKVVLRCRPDRGDPPVRHDPGNLHADEREHDAQNDSYKDIYSLDTRDLYH